MDEDEGSERLWPEAWLDVFGERLVGTAAVSSLGSSKVANMSMESHVSAMAFEGTTGPDAAQAHSRSPNDGFIITIIVPSQVCGETLYPKAKSWNLSFPRFQRQRPSHCQKFHSTTSGLPNQQNTQSLPKTETRWSHMFGNSNTTKGLQFSSAYTSRMRHSNGETSFKDKSETQA